MLAILLALTALSPDPPDDTEWGTDTSQAQPQEQSDWEPDRDRPYETDEPIDREESGLHEPIDEPTRPPRKHRLPKTHGQR